MLSFLSRSLVLVSLCMSLMACSPGQSVSLEGPAVITPDGHAISIEVAVTDEDRMKGLMFREELDQDAGMLFVFSEMEIRSFWMKNTLIPLDVLYIDDKGKVVDIQTMPPCPEDADRCPMYESAAPSQYALEINGGRAEELGIEVGDQLDLKVS